MILKVKRFPQKRLQIGFLKSQGTASKPLSRKSESKAPTNKQIQKFLLKNGLEPISRRASKALSYLKRLQTASE